MILNYTIDLLCILFLLFTALICFSWARLRNDLEWKGRRHVALIVKGLVIFVGCWHLAFAVLKMAWMVTEVMTWGI